MRRAFVVLSLVLALSCRSRETQRTADPPRGATLVTLPAGPLVSWLPAGTLTVARAPGATISTVEVIAKGPGRPACAAAQLAGIRESYMLQRDPAEPMATVLVGRFDREQLEACTVELARSAFGLALTPRRDGPVTIFTSERGDVVAGYAADRVVIAASADHVRAIIAPARPIAADDRLAQLLPRLGTEGFSMVTSTDYVQRWTQLPALGMVFVTHQPAGAPPSFEARIPYTDPDSARRAIAALGRAATDPAVPAVIRETYALLHMAVDGNDLVFDPSVIFAPENGELANRLQAELLPH